MSALHRLQAQQAVEELRAAPKCSPLGTEVGMALGPRDSIRAAAGTLAAVSTHRGEALEQIRRKTLLDSVKFSHPRCYVRVFWLFAPVVSCSLTQDHLGHSCVDAFC